jgi:hypothetical protein
MTTMSAAKLNTDTPGTMVAMWPSLTRATRMPSMNTSIMPQGAAACTRRRMRAAPGGGRRPRRSGRRMVTRPVSWAAGTSTQVQKTSAARSRSPWRQSSCTPLSRVVSWTKPPLFMARKGKALARVKSNRAAITRASVRSMELGLWRRSTAPQRAHSRVAAAGPSSRLSRSQSGQATRVGDSPVRPGAGSGMVSFSGRAGAVGCGAIMAAHHRKCGRKCPVPAAAGRRSVLGIRWPVPRP